MSAKDQMNQYIDDVGTQIGLIIIQAGQAECNECNEAKTYRYASRF